ASGICVYLGTMTLRLEFDEENRHTDAESFCMSSHLSLSLSFFLSLSHTHTHTHMHHDLPHRPQKSFLLQQKQSLSMTSKIVHSSISFASHFLFSLFFL